MGHPSATSFETLDDFVEAFEEAWGRGGPVNLADFLPPADHPHFLDVLRELVRVDLEYGWQRGQPLSLEGYRERFPALFAHRGSLNDITFEEYRLRLQHGEAPTPAEYERRFGIDPFAWPVVSPSNDNPQDLTSAAKRYQSLRRRQEEGDAQSLSAWFGDCEGDVPTSLLRDIHARDPEEADRVAAAVTSFPEPGTDFLGFHLEEEVGRGAFGRVYLARQGDLAGRQVALKVTARRFAEAQTLAQLQHTHIVPIYSVHESGPLQAVCMPWLGATTLADLIRRSRGKASTLGAQHRSTLRAGPAPADAPESAAAPSRPPAHLWEEAQDSVAAVLRIGAELAAGLAHAHERGIVHRDLKPANVLLTDDGRALLLDFNLAADGHSDSASSALVGGTLPYMAPEHLTLFADGRGSVDGRADIYALGVILYELLAGRLPFEMPPGPSATAIARAAAVRGTPPPLRHANPNVTPAVEAIVRRCLEADPARRYATARALEEDINAHLADRPLRHIAEPSLRERARKWYRRHPRLAIGLSVGAFASVLLGALLTLAVQQRLKNERLEATNAVLRAADTRARFQAEMRAAQVSVLDSLDAGPKPQEQARARCAEALALYHVLDAPNWQDADLFRYLPETERSRLKEDVGEMLLLLARSVWEEGPDPNAEALRWNTLAATCFAEDAVPAAVWMQRAQMVGPETPEGRQLRERAASRPALTARDLALLATDRTQRREYAAAEKLLDYAVRRAPDLFTLWIDLAICHENQAHFADAAACYGTCIALAPQLPSLYLRRGIVRLKQERFAQARADLDRAIELQPELADAYLHRSLAAKGLRDYDAAIVDATEAVKYGSPPVRAYLIRSRLYAMKGKAAEAERDLELGMKHEPVGEACWLTRGSARRLPQQAAEALADFDKALSINPRSLLALENKAYLLAEVLQRPKDALAVLETTVKLYPDHALSRANRGVLLARLGNRSAAHRDARDALDLDRQPAIVYRAACIYALTSAQHGDDRTEALRLLGDALWQRYGLDFVESDADLASLRGMAEFRRIVEQARARK